jgi:uncharacterized membrane protein
MSGVVLFAAVGLACAVEMVEAVTIVLAVGVVRGWRSPLIGVAAAGAMLAILVAALGPTVRLLPIGALRLVVGVLLVSFGLQWLRKAILRTSGYRPLRDEAEAFRRGREQAFTAESGELAGLDWYGFTIAFKGVLLEGFEVAFIVVSFGTGQGRLALAASAALCALVVVAGAAMAVRAPLARIPENRIKFAVGLLLTTFGTFWAVEGAGLRWPGDELAVPALLGFFIAVSLTLARLLRRQRLALSTLTVGA